MKIGLVSARMRENALEEQINEIKNHLEQAEGYDLLCFGESFLQGFEGLSWEYEQDRSRALTVDSAPIQQIVRLAEHYHCGLSFGFIEREGEVLYSSNLVISKRGNFVDLFRRVSPGWKEPHADFHYQEGDGFHTFRINGLTFAAAICGDLWDEANITALGKLKYDVLLWPLYVDYSVEQWEKEQLAAYAAQAGKTGKPVLMVNSWVDDPTRAKGGCYYFEAGKVTAALPAGQGGVLGVEL